MCQQEIWNILHFKNPQKKNFKEEKTSFIKTLKDIFYEPEWNFTVLGVEPVYNGYKKSENKAALVLTEDGPDYIYKSLKYIEYALNKEIGFKKCKTNVVEYEDFNEDAPASMCNAKVVIVELV